ncbi:MAG: histidinol dehydrogenase [Chloroflexi bacterium]|nr:histidinol dehydrogenase [Chloroflexota bacterium]
MSIRVVHGADAVRRELIARHGELAVVDEAARQRASAVFGESLSPREFVAKVVERVRADGDEALRAIAAKVGDHIPSHFEVSPAELAAAREKAPSDLTADLETAAERIRAFHQRQMPRDFFDDASGVGQRWIPVERAGIHIPGASGPLASSVLMTAIPARVAGVRETVVCTAAAEDGIDPVIALAAHVAEVDRAFLVSGAQAIAAMAVGTASVPRCDAVVAPGNAWVVLATREVFGLTGVSVLPGPTETVVIADATADPADVAADLIAQAEHGGPASPIALTDSAEFAAEIAREIERQLDSLPRQEVAADSFAARGGVGVVADLDEAVTLANEYAPEHLCLLVADPQRLLEGVRNAGGVFVGAGSPEVHGDYVAGPSHVMPTGGSARFASPCGVHAFLKSMSVVRLDADDSQRLAPVAARMARAERLEGHARAAERRQNPAGP